MLLHRHAPEVLELTFIGQLDVDDGAAVRRWFDTELRRCRHAVLFLDLEGFASYASSVRSDNQRLLLELRAHWSAIHTFGGSRLVRMGLAVADLALGGVLRGHPSRASFDDARQQALRGPR